MSPITVRHVLPTDAPALQHIYSQPDTQANTLQLPFPASQLWQERTANLRPGVHSLVACIDDRVVGQITLEVIATARRRHTATFGLGVDEAFRGQGVGKALLAAIVDLCDNWLQVSRIELTVFTDNEAAVALYQQFGFVVEGTARQYAMRHGVWVDAFYMARLQ
ncbi:GNAT family N-acetyltransferase [Candidatus Pantoea multigeneris]|uniref:GNAT family N-acetyltransferase n=1 Tax=Candidatus Pantoea multigeneris TaxID=2608357 RepID=A0ABX0RLI3_9GAMM|nr:GNAT family N-acetyltransferase [Pantoea multigeneris]NIF24254.1 GNAT family N-acetyltransferase [Pantoea multigeneris]